MNTHIIRRLRNLALLSLALTVSAIVAPSTARCASIDDAVFAHDFEALSGDSIAALRGPSATKSSNVSTGTSNNVGTWSHQYIKTPGGSSFGHIDTNTRLNAATSDLSFTISYNDRGGNSGGNDPYHIARLLTSYYSASASTSNQLYFDVLFLSGSRKLRLGAENSFVESTVTVPYQDSQWHQAGFTFHAGVVTFYLDGVIIGAPVTLPNVSSLPAQTSNWFLLEDVNSNAAPLEYFANGSYDEAALWTRTLSPIEMSSIASGGLSTATAQPAGIAIFHAAEIAWSTELNKTYQLQWTLDLNLGVWNNLGSKVAGTGTEMNAFDSTRTRSKRFYRIVTTSP